MDLFSVFLLIPAILFLWYFLGPKPSSNRTPDANPSSGGSYATCSEVVKSQDEGVDGGLVIIYGSQTGTAEAYAKTLLQEARRNKIPCKIVDAAECVFDRLPTEKAVIFVLATYGEGEPTDSAREMHEWLFDADRENDDFSGLKYAVFGLGDSQYKHFCQTGREFDARLEQIGATRAYELGIGDADRSLEDDFDLWKSSLWGTFAPIFGLTAVEDTNTPVEPTMAIDYPEGAQPAATPFPKMASALEPTQKQPVYARVAVNVEMLKGVEDRSTRHIEIDVSESAITYQAGDHAGILPCNPDAVVADYANVLGLSDAQLDRVVILYSREAKAKRTVLPAKVTLRTALKWYVDLCGAPRKSALRAFAHYCTDDSEKENFLSHLMVSEESTAKYHKLHSKVRTVHGFLRKYKSCKVPIDHFLEMMPRITPRYFSIASDQLRHGKRIHLTVALVADGLCTSWLTKLSPGDVVPIFVRKSTFHLPVRAKDRPIVMIGPGTGVAPLIGFMHRRAAWQEKKQVIGKALMFFGCRNSQEDYIHREVMEESLASGVISTLALAFSREGPKKVYVQHRIMEHAAEVNQVIADGGNVYICGDAKHMAKDVEETLVKILVQHGGMTEEKAKEKLNRMEKTDRFLKDVWTS
eukprot:PhM_4_TR10002/c0_g1_i1/m.90412/K00327/POR; NADPH-ferrihemoprotein reductase